MAMHGLLGAEDLVVNDTESIVEWVLEDMLAIDDAIPEQDEQDTEKKTQQFPGDWENHHASFLQLDFPLAKTSQTSLAAGPLLSPVRCVVSPPPERIA